MCEHAVVRTPAVQNRSLMPSGSPSSGPALAFCQPRICGARHVAGAIRRFQHEGIERARLLDSGEMRLGKFGCGEVFIFAARRGPAPASAR